MELAFGFWASKTFLSAVELGVFTELARGPAKAQQIQQKLGLHPRSVRDFLDTLVALGALERTGDVYSNSAESDFFLDRNKPSYVGGIMEMIGTRQWPIWGGLTDALKTGRPQSEAKEGGELFEKLYDSPDRLKAFLSAMTGISKESGKAIARVFAWDKVKSFCDVGAAQGAVPVQIALAHPHLRGIGFDLPQVKPIFEEYVRANGLSDRLSFHAGNFFEDALPNADVIVMGHILHDWDLQQKQMLIQKAYAALPPGGAFLVHESLIDDDRRANAFGLLMSINMLVETPGGFDFTGADCQQWMKEAGFARTEVVSLDGPNGLAIGWK